MQCSTIILNSHPHSWDTPKNEMQQTKNEIIATNAETNPRCTHGQLRCRWVVAKPKHRPGCDDCVWGGHGSSVRFVVIVMIVRGGQQKGYGERYRGAKGQLETYGGHCHDHALRW